LSGGNERLLVAPVRDFPLLSLILRRVAVRPQGSARSTPEGVIVCNAATPFTPKLAQGVDGSSGRSR